MSGTKVSRSAWRKARQTAAIQPTGNWEESHEWDTLAFGRDAFCEGMSETAPDGESDATSLADGGTQAVPAI
jgi:hypothetical protein